VGITGSLSVSFGGFRTTQLLSEILQFSVFSLLFRERNKKKKKLLSDKLVWQLATVAPGLLELFYAIKS
jgi:hypothetical protein